MTRQEKIAILTMVNNRNPEPLNCSIKVKGRRHLIFGFGFCNAYVMDSLGYNIKLPLFVIRITV